MARRPARAALAVGGLVPAFGTLTTLLADPWLATAAMGLAVVLAGLGSWVLCRHPYFEIHEISAEGSRIRRWRFGIERHSARSRPWRDASRASPGTLPPPVMGGTSTPTNSAAAGIPQRLP